jgi:glycosyltransferase involved in cell wall biosynthesis
VVIYDLILAIRLLVTFPKPDIFYVRVAYFSLFTPLLAKFLRKKLVLEINGFVVDDVSAKGWRWPLNWVSISCEKFLHKISDASISVSEVICRSLRETFAVPEGKLFCLANGVNIEHFCPLDKQTCRRKLGLAPELDYIGYVGCFTDWDGIDSIIKALPNVKKDFPAVKLLLVGDGDRRTTLVQNVKELGLSEEVIFTGYVSYQDLPVYLNAFTVAVAPYGGSKAAELRNTKGSSSLKTLEYLSAALPVIAGNIPGVEYVENTAGFLIPQSDVSALATKVKILLGDKTLREKFARAGRQYAVQNCSWQAVADRTKEIFASMLKG